ncbi:MAG: hypothetical protein HQ519_03820, partial [Planctomycetes bacterium]|nr:hypothetical protein [Planctomycetota bacterium]
RAPPPVHDQFIFEYVRAAERIRDGVFEPINFEICEIEMIPLVTERFYSPTWYKIYKSGNAIDDRITFARGRNQDTRLDHSIFEGNGIDQLKRRFGDGFAKVV